MGSKSSPFFVPHGGSLIPSDHPDGNDRNGHQSRKDQVRWSKILAGLPICAGCGRKLLATHGRLHMFCVKCGWEHGEDSVTVHDDSNRPKQLRYQRWRAQAVKVCRAGGMTLEQYTTHLSEMKP